MTQIRPKLFRQVALLSAPLVLQNLSQTLLGVVDTYFVSRIGTDAVAAVGLAGIIFFTVLVLFRNTANSTMIFVSRAHGAEDDAKVGTAVWLGLNMVAWLSLLVLLLPLFFRFVFTLAAPPDNPLVTQLGIRYLQIRAIEIPMIMFSTVVWAFLVGRNDSRTPMILSWSIVLLNIWLDWLLVLGHWGLPQMGVVGAAYGTLIANTVGALLSAAILWRRKNRDRYATHHARRMTWPELRAGFVIGIPMGLGDFFEIASFSTLFALIARLGTEVLVANQIALQYISLSFTFGLAISMATSSLVSQYIGANKPDLAEKITYHACLLAMICMGLIGLSYLIAPARLIGFFSQEPTVIAAGTIALRVAAVFQIVDALGIVLAGALNGAGDTRFTMLVRLVLAWGLFIPLVWMLLFRFNGASREAWIGATIYLALLALVYFLRLRSGRWRTIKLD